MRLVQLSRHSIAFPSPEGALREPNGLLALGGDLSPARLLMAYQRGISGEKCAENIHSCGENKHRGTQKLFGNRPRRI